MISFINRKTWILVVIFAVAGLLSACDNRGSGSRPTNGGDVFENCLLSNENLFDGGVSKDGIPALTDPPLVGPDAEEASYLADTSRVIGLLVGDKALAVPHNILWRHEIVNLDEWINRPIAVTYCPLTGSSLAFDRSAVDGAEFGVSGLLLDNNLVMYNRQDNESLWPQMNRAANCGPASGTRLEMVPVVEMRWNQWKDLHPDTRVISSETGHRFTYNPRSYPYGDYERLDNESLLFDETPIDERRPPKERVLGIPAGSNGGLALPFGALDNGAPARVVEVSVASTNAVVFWNRSAQAAMAFESSSTFTVENGQIVDAETGSVWTVEGRAVEGERSGEKLTPVREAYVAFWFAWAVFQPDTALWTSS